MQTARFNTSKALADRGRTIDRLPVIQGRLAHPVLAGQIARLRACLVLAQNRNDLFLYSVSSSQATTFDAGSLLLFAVGTRPPA